MNGMLSPWTGKYDGVPPFDKIKSTEFLPAIRMVIRQQFSLIANITQQSDLPTFENTILPLETGNHDLDHVQRLFDFWNTNMNDAAFKADYDSALLMLTELDQRLVQNEPLFARIKTIKEAASFSSLDPQQQRLTEIYYQYFVRRGGGLNNNDKNKLSEINLELARLQGHFMQNINSDERTRHTTITDVSQLDGLPNNIIESFARLAKEYNATSPWIVPNRESSVNSVLTSCAQRGTREKVWQLYRERGNIGPTDNNTVIVKILKLRRERSQMLGERTYAHWRLKDNMLKDSVEVETFLENLWTALRPRAEALMNDLRTAAANDGVELRQWDVAYYLEKVRRTKFSLDEKSLKEYLQLENVRNGMFWMAGQLFGYGFKQVYDVPVYHPDVTTWEVIDLKSGKSAGLWYFDPYARDGKRTGAWTSRLRTRGEAGGNVVLVANTCNYSRPKEGQPTLLSWREAEILFHEFGHALNLITSNAKYPARCKKFVIDFGEFPSQLLENWVATPEITHRFLLHYQSSKSLPDTTLNKLVAYVRYGETLRTVSGILAAMVDLGIHLASPESIDPHTYEQNFLKTKNAPLLIGPRYRLQEFLHIFDGEDYPASYYAYQWSLVMADDVFAAFSEEGGPFNSSTASRYKANILSTSVLVDAAEAYRLFRGRDPSTAAYITRRK